MKKNIFRALFQITLFIILFSACKNPLTANKTEKETATYEVHHRREKIDGSFDESEEEIQILTGYVGDMTNAQPLTTTLYNGFVPQYVWQKVIKKEKKVKLKDLDREEEAQTDEESQTEEENAPNAEDEEITIRTVVIIEYYRIKYKYTFKDRNSVIGEIEGKYQEPVPQELPLPPLREDAFFEAWEPSVPETFESNITFNAVWRSSDADYLVLHRKQNINNDEYTTFDEETKTAPANRTTNAEAKNLTGFTAKPITQRTIAEDGSTVVSVYYDRNVYTLTFNTAGGSEVEAVQGKYQATVPSITAPQKQGYTFNGWSPQLAETFQDNVEYTAQWLAATNTPYKVEYYLQKLDLTGYDKDDEETFYGTSNATTTVEAKSYTGFTAKDINQTSINVDGSSLVKVYYDRNSYTIKFMNEDEVYRTHTNLRYGANLPNPGTPTRTGYTFNAWSPALTETVTTQTEYIAQWTPRTDTEYTVRALLQRTDHSGYEVRAVLNQHLTGTTGELTNAGPVDVDGYVARMDFEQLPIAGDGSTVIDIYYDIAD